MLSRDKEANHGWTGQASCHDPASVVVVTYFVAHFASLLFQFHASQELLGPGRTLEEQQLFVDFWFLEERDATVKFVTAAGEIACTIPLCMLHSPLDS